MKTTKADFKVFQKEFLMWVDLFGLKEYNCFFHHDKLADTDYGNYVCAELCVDDNGKAATVTLATDIPKGNRSVLAKRYAKHEAIHLLLRKLSWLGKCRYLTDGEMANEEEAVVGRLQKIL